MIRSEKQRSGLPVVGKQLAVSMVNELEFVCTGSCRPLSIKRHCRITNQFIVDPCNDAETSLAARHGSKTDGVMRAKVMCGFASHAHIAQVFQGHAAKGALTRIPMDLGGKPKRSSGQQGEGT